MSDYSYYITPEEYEIAEKNGISKRLLNERVRVNGWGKKRAITTPVRKQKKYDGFIRVALMNGISRTTFYMRVYNGEPLDVAATRPPKKPGQILSEMQDRRRKYSDEILETCKKNGICMSTFLNRVNKMKWPIEKAANTPIQQRGKYKRKRKTATEPTKVTEAAKQNVQSK